VLYSGYSPGGGYLYNVFFDNIPDPSTWWLEPNPNHPLTFAFPLNTVLSNGNTCSTPATFTSAAHSNGLAAVIVSANQAPIPTAVLAVIDLSGPSALVYKSAEFAWETSPTTNPHPRLGSVVIPTGIRFGNGKRAIVCAKDRCISYKVDDANLNGSPLQEAWSATLPNVIGGPVLEIVSQPVTAEYTINGQPEGWVWFIVQETGLANRWHLRGVKYSETGGLPIVWQSNPVPGFCYSQPYTDDQGSGAELYVSAENRVYCFEPYDAALGQMRTSLAQPTYVSSVIGQGGNNSSLIAPLETLVNEPYDSRLYAASSDAKVYELVTNRTRIDDPPSRTVHIGGYVLLDTDGDYDGDTPLAGIPIIVPGQTVSPTNQDGFYEFFADVGDDLVITPGDLQYTYRPVNYQFQAGTDRLGCDFVARYPSYGSSAWPSLGHNLGNTRQSAVPGPYAPGWTPASKVFASTFAAGATNCSPVKTAGNYAFAVGKNGNLYRYSYGNGILQKNDWITGGAETDCQSSAALDQTGCGYLLRPGSVRSFSQGTAGYLRAYHFSLSYNEAEFSAATEASPAVLDGDTGGTVGVVAASGMRPGDGKCVVAYLASTGLPNGNLSANWRIELLGRPIGQPLVLTLQTASELNGRVAVMVFDNVPNYGVVRFIALDNNVHYNGGVYSAGQVVWEYPLWGPPVPQASPVLLTYQDYSNGPSTDYAVAVFNQQRITMFSAATLYCLGDCLISPTSGGASVPTGAPNSGKVYFHVGNRIAFLAWNTGWYANWASPPMASTNPICAPAVDGSGNIYTTGMSEGDLVLNVCNTLGAVESITMVHALGGLGVGGPPITAGTSVYLPFNTSNGFNMMRAGQP
jgi:hypothetical protein